LFWNSGKDPDNFAIPYLTAIGDLLGTAFLAVVFHKWPEFFKLIGHFIGYIIKA
jgi:hypothetical protein